MLTRRQNPKTATKRRPYTSSDLKMAYYESLKASLTATAKTSAEYSAACQRAAKMAGV